MTEYQYPLFPGSKAQETSHDAAVAMAPEARNLQADCLRALRSYPQTADEVADFLNRSILSIRPRLSELLRLGKITDTGFRRLNQSGKNAIVWKIK